VGFGASADYFAEKHFSASWIIIVGLRFRRLLNFQPSLSLETPVIMFRRVNMEGSKSSENQKVTKNYFSH